MDDLLSADLRAAVALGGEMGGRFAALDWAAHPLGPPAAWPPEVRSVVAVALASRFPTVLWLGDDLRLVYNDPYIPMLSEKHPAALGRPGREVWADIWEVVGPMLDGVRTTGVATWSDDLRLVMMNEGRPRERYFTFTYSPILAGDGSVSAVFCAVDETTERVLSERRLQLLTTLGGALLDATTPSGAVHEAMRVCGGHPDLPFVATYLVDAVTGGCPLEAATASAADRLAVATPTVASWLEQPPDAGAVLVEDPGPLDGLRERLGPDCPTQALVLALGDAGQAATAGWLVVGLAPRRTLDEQYRSFCGLLADQIAAAVANARAYELERRRAEALAELDAAKTAFFTNVSHELRTPLTLLLGPAEDALADRGEPLSPGQAQRMELVARNGRRLLALVNTLLDLSRLQAGTTRARYEATDVAELTARLATMFGSAVERAGLDLRVETATLPGPVHVDREMWTKIVLNLLSNAVKFTFGGGITVRVRPVEGAVELSVTDTGEGIEPAELPQVFERFHRPVGTRSRSYEGSGIGLALVAELAALHGGTVTAESEPGVGSTFSVRIPYGTSHLPADQVVASDADGVAEAAEPVTGDFLAESLWWLEEERGDRTPPSTAPPGAAAVLVADDNVDMRDYIARLLAPHYRVTTAVDGADALARARSDPPDLVLTDVMMPNLDGFALLSALRADPATTAVPVVFLSARAGADGVAEGLEAGADDYIAKPFAARELLARVRANLELDRSRRTRAALERSEELLDQAQRLARVGSWEVEVATGSMLGSDELLRLLGLTRDEFEGLDYAAVLDRAVHPDDRQALDAIWGRALDDGEPFRAEIRLASPDGSERWARVHGEVLAGPDGCAAKLRGSLQDIEDQRQAERQLAATEAAREAAMRERRIADELQTALLPSAEVEPEELDVATFYRAGAEGTQVGGDWYDVIDLGAGRTALVLGDVMGRGVRAAAVMGQLRSAVRAFARLDLPPADVLEYLDAVVRDLGGEQLVTCVYGIHDAVDGTFTFANAGHLPPLLVAGGARATTLRRAGPPLGAGPLSLPEDKLALAPGSMVALYSDGLVERRDRDLEEGIALLADQLLEHAHGHLPARVQALVDAVLPDDPDDDVALLLARVRDHSTPYRSIDWQVPPHGSAVAGIRRAAAATLGEWGADGELIDDVVLAVSELVTNAVVHGRPPVEVRIRCSATEVVLEVDDGSPAPPRRLRPTPADEHGRGLQLIAGRSGRWGTRPVANGKSVWCTFTLDRHRGTPLVAAGRPGASTADP
ncbi:MAG: SpoIIE family protein phosphatase [Acidimicrobiales bacterium]